MVLGEREHLDAGTGEQVDWTRWNTAYESAESPLAQRLALVQRQVRAALDRAPAGAPVKAISICAGQGQDLIGVLAGHPRRADVSARLIELDEDSVRHARGAAGEAGLDGVEVIAADASLSDAYAGAVPAGLVLVCGVFGNISEGDIGRLIELLPELCSEDATVIWTRHRNPPDMTPRIREAFAQSGFSELAFEHVGPFGVGAHRLAGRPLPLRAGVKLFDFIGHRALWPHLPEGCRDALQALFRPDCSLVELVEAMRALPYGQPGEATAEAMLREARGTSAIKHLFLAQVLAVRFPQSRPQLVHRVYQLRRDGALARLAPSVAAAIPAAGLTDVHRYLRIAIDGRPLQLDVSLSGAPWDGRSSLALACAHGEDLPVGPGEAADAHMQRLEEDRCDAAARGPLLAALAALAAPGSRSH